MGKQHQHLNAYLSAVNTSSTKRIELALLLKGQVVQQGKDHIHKLQTLNLCQKKTKSANPLM